MSSYIDRLGERINPPKWLRTNVMFEGLTGSVAYGCSNDTSDMDIVGFCIPPKDVIFPHLRGDIPGFGSPGEVFNQFQQHGVEVPEWGKSFDITIYSIVKFFQLVMENNPNMVDALFLPRRCVLHSTEIYEHVRDHRKLFLHKGCWHKFRGYSYSQMSKITRKVNSTNPKRAASIEEFGMDVKFAYHVVRLLLEVEQILAEQDLDLERNSEMLTSIRKGEWSLEKLQDWATAKEKVLEALYHSSTLPYSPPEAKIKSLLLECLEMHYGSLSNTLMINPQIDKLLSDLECLTEKYKRHT